MNGRTPTIQFQEENTIDSLVDFHVLRPDELGQAIRDENWHGESVTRAARLGHPPPAALARGRGGHEGRDRCA